MIAVSSFHPWPLKSSSHFSRRRLKCPHPFSLSPSYHSSNSNANVSVSFRRPFRIRAIDAAQLFDRESKLAAEFQNAQKLKIAIVGFGNFGQFLAKTLVRQGHTVLAHSRSDYSDTARNLGVTFFPNPDDLCEEHPEVLLLCSSIISTEQVLLSLPLQRLKRNTLVVDVLSVKEFPKNLLLEVLPSDFDVICSHPMFGPESAGHGWSGLSFVYEKVRIGDEESRVARCEKFLKIFAREGCKMVEMSCAEHDKYAAESQFITHTVGRVLKMLTLDPTPISTKGYESLLGLVEQTSRDSFDLYYGLFMYNKNSLEMLEALVFAFEEVRQELIGRLHGVVRKQLFENAGKMQDNYAVLKRAQNGDAGKMQDNYAVLKVAQNAVLKGAQNGDAGKMQDNYAMLKGAQNGDAGKMRDNYALLKGAQNGASVTRCHDVDHLHNNRSNNSNSQFDENSKLKIAIIGFGNFGQFLARTIVRQGHKVLAYSRSDHSDVARELGVSHFNDADDLCEQQPEVILICTSILSTEHVLNSLPVQRLKRSTLFVDVLSVKEFPRNLFLQQLPPYFDVLCTHPMFGPESGKNGWKGLPFVFDKVRIGRDESRMSRCDQFLDIFASEGCRMVEMSCADHDQHAAGSQFITHTTGRILGKLGLKPTPINTKGYETLLSLVKNTAGDSFDLYYGLFMYNINAMEQLQNLDRAFETLKQELFHRLHGVYRKQLFGNAEQVRVLPEKPMLPERSESSNVVSSLSNTVDTK